MSASCSAVGCGTTPASAKMNTPFSPIVTAGVVMMKQLETTEIPGSRPTRRRSGRSVSAVEWQAPATEPSASSARSRSAAVTMGSITDSQASSSVAPLAFRASR